MRPIVLALVLAACSSSATRPDAASPAAAKVAPPEAPATPASMDLAPTGAPQAWRLLDHLDSAQLQFPPDDGAPAPDGRFVLEGKWKDEGVRKGGWHQYSTGLPFASSMPRPNYAPLGARMFRGAEEIPFETKGSGPSDAPRTRWWVEHGRLVLLTDNSPRGWTEPAELRVPELAAALAKRSFARAGQSPAEFARTSHTEGRTTRPGLYLPAPATAEFSAPLPAKGELRFGLALLPDPVSGAATGDGADVEITLDGASLWKGHCGAEHQDVAVPLPAGAARTGTLRITTSHAGSPDGDFVVLTAPAVVDTGVATPRRIVVVGIDTLRWDALGKHGAARATSPELDRWLDQSVSFANAYAPAPRTKPSFRSAFSGAYPSSPKPTAIAEVLAAQGFATGGIVANVHLVPRFGFNRGMDHWEYENGAKADQQVDRALAWATAHRDQDSYLFVHLMDPHTFYDAPEGYKGRFQEGRKRPKNVPARFNRWSIYTLMKKQRLGDEGKAWIRAAYDEEVAFATHELARLLAGIEELPGRTLTVVHTDHGEEFWDHRGFEHNHSLYDELVHAVLAVRPPGGWKGAPTVQQNVGLIDIAPTLYDFAGVPASARPRTDGTSLRPLIDPARATEAPALSTQLDGRPLLLGHLRFNRDRWGVVYQKYKYILQTASGTQELYDLEADPGEQNNLYATADDVSLGQLRAALERASGWPVRPGFRVRVPATAKSTTFTFEAPILDVAVMDPELHETVRANLEWGEKPKRAIAEIGTVQLAEDRRSFRFEPGSNPTGGTLLLQCESAPCPAGKLKMGDIEAPVVAALTSGASRYLIESGTIIIPHDRSDLPEGGDTLATTEREQLESLGYLHADEDDPAE